MRCLRGIARVKAIVFLSTLAGCGVLSGGPELPDGDYRLRLSEARFPNPFLAPEWMTYIVELDFTRRGDVVSVTASAGGIVSEGPAQRFEAIQEGWLLEFSLSGREGGSHYWSVEITDERCTMAQAVDAFLPVGDDGLVVPFTACFITRR